MHMPQFLDRIVLDNPIVSYIWIAGIIAAMFLLKGFVSKFICRLLYGIFPGAKKYLGRDQFISLVLAPMEWLLFAVVVILSLDKLKFPALLDFELYKVSAKEIADGAGKFILIVLFIRFLIRQIDFLAIILETKASETPDHTDDQLVVFFKDFFKAILNILGIIMIAKFVFHFNVSNLITGLSIVTAAIALATKESLENLIASFIIFFDKPYTIGDFVKVESVSGTVERIGLRSTRIRTEQKTFVTVPNKKMVDSILDNITHRTQRKAEIKLDVSVHTSSEQLLQLTQKAEQLIQQHETIQSGTAFVTELGLKSITVQVDYFTDVIDMGEFNKLKQTMNIELLNILATLEIELAGVTA